MLPAWPSAFSIVLYSKEHISETQVRGWGTPTLLDQLERADLVSIRFHMPGSNVSFATAIKPKDKCRFCIDILLFVLFSTERLIEQILHIF
jgi:hypothetical protein